MSWGEAWRLTQQLALDTSSHVAAAVNGWEYPASRVHLVLADLYDTFVSANTKKGRKAKPYPRPWPDRNKSSFGRATRPQVEIRAALAARGHGRPVPRRDSRGRLRDERGRFVKA